MAKIVILGAGVMGSAFCFPLCDSGNTVHLVGTHLDREIVYAIRGGSEHPRLGVRLPSGVAAYESEELGAVLTEDTDLVVLGVSSAGVTWAVDRIADKMKKLIPVLMLTKGLALDGDGCISTFPDLVASRLADAGVTGLDVGAVGGPCIAGELAVRRHTGVTAGFRDPRVLESVRGLLRAPYYHHRGTLDLTGLEACAALKNFYAIAVGAAAGMLEQEGEVPNRAGMNNPAALLFSQSLSEMAWIVESMGGSTESVYGHPGAGDFYVTCQAGRNSRLGRLIGGGLRYQEAKTVHMPEETVEGAELALAIGPALSRLGAEHVPVAAALVDAICGNKPLKIPWDGI